MQSFLIKKVVQNRQVIVLVIVLCCLLFKFLIRTMPLENSSTLWKECNSSRTWFIITTSKVKVEMDHSVVGRVHLDNRTLTRLSSNSREAYRVIAQTLINKNWNNLSQLIGINLGFKTQSKIALFQRVFVSSDGWIVHDNESKAVRNGGCYSPNNLFIRKIFVPKYDRVISIAVFWGAGVWHFPMESLVGLSYMSDEEKRSCFIHVNSKNDWVLFWLRLAGIRDDNVIEGTIYANNLMVPQTATCGNPGVEQIHWLKHMIPQQPILSQQKSVLLIKRTQKRVMPNFSDVMHIVQDFAKLQNLNFVLHDDSSLPSFQEQSRRFAEASVVVGPHGAGLVHLISAKERTCVIEFLTADPNLCYMRLSLILGHNYFSVPLYADQSVSTVEVRNALFLCTKSKL